MHRLGLCALVLLAAGCSITPAATPTSTPPRPMLVWTPGGLPPGFAATVAHLPGVAHSVTVVGGTVWLTRPSSPTSKPIPAGMAIPLDIAGAPVPELRRFWPARDHQALRAMQAGEAVIGTTEERLRHRGQDGWLQLGSTPLAIGSVVPDADVGAHELFVSARKAAKLGITRPTYMLVEPAPGVGWRTVAARIHAAAPGTKVRIRGPGRAAYLRQGDAVLPPVFMKSMFGEFAVDPHIRAGGWTTIDPAWLHGHITTAWVPILGRVTCNRALFPQLRGALAEVKRRGLSALILRGQYAGCYAPRFIPGSVGPSLSHHAWGAALDINSLANPFGERPHQDPRLVAIFARWGFTWGGRWIVPDGMHFEYLTPASG